MQKNNLGFTLIELLIVIAIIAILALFVILFLNPPELLRQARDSSRFSDLDTLDHALQTYQVNNSVSGQGSMGSTTVAYVSIPDPVATTTAGDHCEGLNLPPLPSPWTYHCANINAYKNIDGTGWVPLDFRVIASQSVIHVLPADPKNDSSTGLYYTYETDGTNYEITAGSESSKYATVCASQDPTYPDLCAKGKNLTLAPIDFYANSPNPGGKGSGLGNWTQSANLAGTSRAFNTVYQNTSSYPIFIAVNGYTTGTGSQWILSDSNSNPSTFIGGDTGGGSWNRTDYAIVPPGNYYKVTYDTTPVTLSDWFEWSLTGVHATQSGNLAGTTRTYNTVYQNTTGYPLFIAVTGNAGSAGSEWLLTDTNASPTTQVANRTGGNAWQRTVYGFILPGSYYEVTYDTGSTLTNWIEWTLTGMNVSQSGNLAGTTRNLNTVYQNTTGHPLFIAINSWNGFTGSDWIYSDSNSTPSTFISGETGQNDWNRTVYTIVPPGNYYESSYDTGSTLTTWFEWTIH